MIPEAQSLFVVAVNTGYLWSTCSSFPRNRVNQQKGKRMTKEANKRRETDFRIFQEHLWQVHVRYTKHVPTHFRSSHRFLVSLSLSALCQGLLPSLTLAGISLNSSCSHRNLRVSECCVTLSSCARNARAARAQKQAYEGMYSRKRP